MSTENESAIGVSASAVWRSGAVSSRQPRAAARRRLRARTLARTGTYTHPRTHARTRTHTRIYATTSPINVIFHHECFLALETKLVSGYLAEHISQLYFTSSILLGGMELWN